MMLTLINPKLSNIFNAVATNLDRTLSSACKSNRIPYARVNVNDLDAHLVNIWFANAETPAEQHATTETVWETFASIAQREFQMVCDRQYANGQNFVEVRRDTPVPFSVFAFEADKLSFVDAALVDGTLFTDLRDFNNMMNSRQQFSEQSWFAENYPAATNFMEALTLLMRKHNITAHEFFNFANPEIANMVKEVTAKLQRHGIRRGDFFKRREEKIQTVEETVANVETTSPELEQDAIDIAEEINKEMGAEVVTPVLDETQETEVPEEIDVVEEEEVSEEEQDVDVHNLLTAILNGMRKYHAKANRGRDRKLSLRALDRSEDLTQEIDELLKLLELLDMPASDSAEFENKIEDAMERMATGAVHVEDQNEEDEIDESDIDEFESSFDESILNEEEIEEETEEDDEIETDLDDVSLEDEDEEIVGVEETDVEEEESFDEEDSFEDAEAEAEAEETEEVEMTEREQQIAQMVEDNSLSTLRRHARLRRLSIAQSRTLSPEELAAYILDNPTK